MRVLNTSCALWLWGLEGEGGVGGTESHREGGRRGFESKHGLEGETRTKKETGLWGRLKHSWL